MGTQVIDRRTLVAGGLAAMLPWRATANVRPPIPPRVERLTVGKRVTDMTVWDVERPQGIALLSTGHGSWPDRYGPYLSTLRSYGFTVLAPLHVDSMRHPDRAAFTREASFGERVADLRAASAWGLARHPGLPVLAAGHSFGTLTALCLAGALPHLGDFRDPAVRAVLGFSTPGRVPGLVTPDAYRGVTVPLLIVTGTADTVPGFVADPADHLFPVETAGGPAYGLVVDGGGHEDLVGGIGAPDATTRNRSRVLPTVNRFVAAHLRANGTVRRALPQWKPADPRDRFIVRNAA